MILHPIHWVKCFILPVLLLSGCRTLRTEAPLESYPPVQVPLKTSVINIPLEMDVKTVETLLNKQLSGLIYNDSSLTDNGGDNLMVKAWKMDNIILDYSGDQFLYRLPLKLWIKAGFKIDKFGFTLSDFREINAGIALKLKSRITLNKDWSVTTSTTSDGYEWLSSPVLKIGPVDLPITYLADLLLKTNKTLIGSKIDKGIAETLPLKKYARQIWLDMQKPFLVSDTFSLWMKITPREIITTGFSSKNGRILLQAGVKSETSLFMGGMPPVKIDTNLPKLLVVNKMDDSFNINLLIGIPFSTARDLATRYLVGKTFVQGKRALTILDVKLYGSNGKLAVEAQVAGSINGKLYFTGKPYYDAADSTVKMQDFDFDIKTKNVLLKTASWAYHGGIAQMIRSKLVFPVGDQLKENKDLINRELRQKMIMDNLVVSGKLDRMDVDSIYLTQESICIGLIFSGKVGVKLNR